MIAIFLLNYRIPVSYRISNKYKILFLWTHVHMFIEGGHLLVEMETCDQEHTT